MHFSYCYVNLLSRSQKREWNYFQLEVSEIHSKSIMDINSVKNNENRFNDAYKQKAPAVATTN